MLESAPLKSMHLTSAYGPRDLDDDGEFTLHAGADFRAAVGTPVFAMGAGFVRAAGEGVAGSGGGWAIDIVDDDDGRYVYLHLESDSLRVRAGDRVEAGQLVALSGNTGASQAPHLHVQWQPNWPATTTVDPAPVLLQLPPPSSTSGGGGGLLIAGAAFGGFLLLRKKKRRR